MIPRTSHIAELQSVRGMAAAAVLVGHSLAVYGLPAGPLNTHAALVIFFVLSGFVLSRSLARRDFGTYFLRRALRIYPMIWTSVLLAALATMIVAPHLPVDAMAPRFEGLIAGQVTFRNLVGGLAGLGYSLNPPLWTVSLELVGSAMIAALALCRGRAGALLAIGAGLLILSFSAIPLPFNAGVYLVDFWLGAMIALAEPAARRLAARLNGWALTALVAPLVLMRSIAPWDYHHPLPNLVEALCAAAILAALAYAPARAGWLRARPLILLGDISYSVYALHFPLLLVCVALVGASDAAAALPVWQRGLLVSGLATAATLALSALTWRCIELPAQALARGGSLLPARNSSPL